MGTNYYLHRVENMCDHCGRADEDTTIHIGKSSGGWVFLLHVGGDAPRTLMEWVKQIIDPDVEIRNEYGDVIDPTYMLRTILNRIGKERSSDAVERQRPQMGAGAFYDKGLHLWRMRSSTRNPQPYASVDLCEGEFS
jgi:hypothetical protein